MDIEDRIRDAVKADLRPEPSLQFHGRVMSSLPDRTVATRLPAWASADFARFVGLAAVVALVVAAVGLPLMQSKTGIATPSESATSTAGVTVGPVDRATSSIAPSPAPSGPSGHFRLTGDMVSKDSEAAAPLADGRVLVMGDSTNPPELYDPVTGRFANTGSMSASRSGETATRLLDGRVLVVGGLGPDPTQGTIDLASAELYDPRMGTFSPTGSMATSRIGHTATPLPDGRVLIAGGTGVRVGSSIQGGMLSSAELYDPKTGRFSPTGSMTADRYYATATLLADGRVLVAGGFPGGTGTPASAEVYDPATGTFSKTGSMPDRRVLSSATLLSDGRVLFSGGQLMNGVDTDLSSALLYDPQTGQFSETGSMVEPRDSATSTRLADGRVLVVGGFTRPSDLPATAKGPVLVSVASAELYDPGTGTFSDAGSMTTARAGHSATLLPDGRVLIAGGLNMTPTTADELGSAELYQP
jgi:hypothetical protein